jgi:hypothetical protein
MTCLKTLPAPIFNGVQSGHDDIDETKHRRLVSR